MLSVTSLKKCIQKPQLFFIFSFKKRTILCYCKKLQCISTEVNSKSIRLRGPKTKD